MKKNDHGSGAFAFRFFEKRYLPKHNKDLNFFDKVKIVLLGSNMNYMLRDVEIETMIYMEKKYPRSFREIFNEPKA